MKNIWSIICEESSIDSQTNSLSLFNCIEEIKLEIDKEKIPQTDKLIIPINFQLISLWLIEEDKERNSLKIKMELVDPDGKVLNESINVLKINKGDRRLRSIINIQGLPITKNGRYYYKILQEKNRQFEFSSEIPIDIKIAYKTL